MREVVTSDMSLSPHPDLAGSRNEAEQSLFLTAVYSQKLISYKPRIGFNEHKSQFVRSCAAEQNDEI